MPTRARRRRAVAREPACKPGSVGDSHSSGTRVAARLERPTRKRRGPRLSLPYLVLLQVGFTLPPVLPPARCALTAPFHPYPLHKRAVCFLWHFPWAHAPQALPGTLPCGARTFLPAAKRGAAAARPTPAPLVSASRFPSATGGAGFRRTPPVSSGKGEPIHPLARNPGRAGREVHGLP